MPVPTRSTAAAVTRRSTVGAASPAPTRRTTCSTAAPELTRTSACIYGISTPAPGTGTLDLSGRVEALHIYLKDAKILVGWGAVTGSGGFISGVDDYVHEIQVDHLGAFTTILGGKGADVFTIYE